MQQQDHFCKLHLLGGDAWLLFQKNQSPPLKVVPKVHVGAGGGGFGEAGACEPTGGAAPLLTVPSQAAGPRAGSRDINAARHSAGHCPEIPKS